MSIDLEDELFGSCDSSSSYLASLDPRPIRVPGSRPRPDSDDPRQLASQTELRAELLPAAATLPPPLAPATPPPPPAPAEDADVDYLRKLIPVSAYDDWHAASCLLEISRLELKLSDGIGALRGPRSSLDPKASRERESRLQLEFLRGKDEIAGTHRRMKEREARAAAVVVPLMEAHRGWSAAQDASPGPSGPSTLLGAMSRAARFKQSTVSEQPSPLRMLLEGLTPQESRCAAEEASLRASFQAAPDRGTQVDVLGAYLCCALRVPPNRLAPRTAGNSSAGKGASEMTAAAQHALFLRRGGSLGRGHSLGVVASVFGEVGGVVGGGG